MNGGKGCTGFTLLEMLLVLVVGGLIVGLTAPRVGGRIDAYRQHYAIQAFEDSFVQLPRRTRLLARRVRLPDDLNETDLGDGSPVFELPAGWQVKVLGTFSVSALGACSAGRMELINDEGVVLQRYQLAEMTCELSPLEE